MLVTGTEVEVYVRGRSAEPGAGRPVEADLGPDGRRHRASHRRQPQRAGRPEAGHDHLSPERHGRRTRHDDGRSVAPLVLALNN